MLGIDDESLLAGLTMGVAIENGIVRCASNATVEQPSEVWVDMAVVLVRDLQSGAESFVTSAGIQIPSEYVGGWLEGGAEGTVGELIASETGCYKQDPHAFLTASAYPRAALLEHAIKLAVASLKLPK